MWTGFFVRVNLKRKRKKAILFNFLCCRKKKKFKQMWESGALVFFFYGEALPGLCMYISGLFPFPLFYFNFSKCLTDVSSLVSLFFSFFCVTCQ